MAKAEPQIIVAVWGGYITPKPFTTFLNFFYKTTQEALAFFLFKDIIGLLDIFKCLISCRLPF
jgi:hypothetical protein